MKNKPKIAIVRGKFLNAYEMQYYEPLIKKFNLTAFGSLKPIHAKFKFPVIKLACPLDLPEFPYKQAILNRILIDAHYLFGLENKLKGFDIIHTAETYFHYTQQALNAKRKGYVKKVIATVSENIPFNNEGILGRKSFKCRALKELDQIIAISELSKKALLLEGADPAKIFVLGHFIDTQEFKPDAQRQVEIASDQQRKFNLLFCGRLEEVKGVFEILEAYELLLNDRQLQNYQLNLTMVGKGSAKSKLSPLAKIKEASYSQMPKVYQQAHLYLAPSKPSKTWIEQYNESLLEEQASGLPIVTTTSGAIPENVGDAALLVRPGDSLGLYRAIRKFLLSSQLRRISALKARQRAVKIHDIAIGAAKLTKVYQAVLK